MKAVENLVDVFRDIVRQEIDKIDTTVFCRVVRKRDSSHYDVYIVPDETSVISNVANMTKINLVAGDYCYVYKIKNSLANSYICYKPGEIPSDEETTTKETSVVTGVVNNVELTGGSVICLLRANFPSPGETNVAYIATDEKRVYFWSAQGNSFVCAGADYNDIKVINGGELS